MVELLYGSGGNVGIQVAAQAPLEAGGFRKIYYEQNRIDHIFEYDAETAGIRLQDGVVIPVALPVDRLYERLYEGRCNLVDLGDVTGAAVKAVARR